MLMLAHPTLAYFFYQDREANEYNTLQLEEWIKKVSRQRQKENQKLLIVPQ